VTVLFADLKGSMELLADRDPEEARAILDPVLERMMEAVHRYEGTVNQVMGDGIMALFGAPLAHEDLAVRACYAALHIQALTLAEELGMRPIMARCHLGLGTLYQNVSRTEQAQAEVTTAAEMYRAMDMTFWLEKAEAVLAQEAS
jgi:class 3 adenylate cyclase